MGVMIERRVTDPHNEWGVAAWLAILTTCMVALATITPYFLTVPQGNATLISQSQTTLYNGWLIVLAYYFATNLGAGRKDAAIQNMASTIKAAQDTLSAVVPPATPGGDPTMVLKPGEAAQVAATPSGNTVVTKDTPP
jgi:type II secretory pathway component PulL